MLPTLLGFLARIPLYLGSLVLYYPLPALTLAAAFVVASHLTTGHWYLRFLGNNLVYRVTRYRERQQLHWRGIRVSLNLIGWLLSHACAASHTLTNNLLYGRIRNTFIRCSSREEAYLKAKAACGQQEPVHHPPHREGDRPHFHVNAHAHVSRNGVRENPHFQY